MAALGFLSGAIGATADWRVLSEDKFGRTEFDGANIVRLENGHYLVLQRAILAQPMSVPSSPPGLAKMVISSVEVDCAARSLANKHLAAAFESESSMVPFFEGDAPQLKFEAVSPRFEPIVDAACK